MVRVRVRARARGRIGVRARARVRVGVRVIIACVDHRPLRRLAALHHNVQHARACLG